MRVPFWKAPRKRVYLHVGTHKTGTTALQIWLALNSAALARAGLLVPLAGRPVSLWDTEMSGHHNIAWQLLGDHRYRERDGSLPELSREIAASKRDTVVLTSEDLAVMYDRPHLLRTLRDAIVDMGYEPHVVFFLRPQRGYIQSFYTELAKQGAPLGFETFLGEVMRDGAFTISGYTIPLDYTPLLDVFSECFGEERTIVRAYRPGAHPSVLPKEFLSIVGTHADLRRLATPGTQNSGVTYAEVLSGLHATFARIGGAVPSLRELAIEYFGNEHHNLGITFAPIGADDARAVAARFEASNRAIAQRFGVNWASDPEPLEQPQLRSFLEHAVTRWSALVP